MNIVFPVLLVFAVLAMVATITVASRRSRQVRSLERAEREGALGEEGLRHARDRASEEWVENSTLGENRPINDVVGSAIADPRRSGRDA